MPVCSLLQRSSMLLNTCFWWKVEYQPLTGICSSSKRISYRIKWLLLQLSIRYMLGSPSCSPNIHLICLAEYCNLLGKQMIDL
ncbi:unnamed protein product [Musa banksii]